MSDQSPGSWLIPSVPAPVSLWSITTTGGPLLAAVHFLIPHQMAFVILLLALLATLVTEDPSVSLPNPLEALTYTAVISIQPHVGAVTPPDRSDTVQRPRLGSLGAQHMGRLAKSIPRRLGHPQDSTPACARMALRVRPTNQATAQVSILFDEGK